MKLITGFVSVVGFVAAVQAANTVLWTKTTIAQANDMFGPRSGTAFSLVTPVDPKNQALHSETESVNSVGQYLHVEPLAVRGVSPGPCFVAQVAATNNPAEQGRVTLHVLDKTAFAIEGPSGEPLHVCSGRSSSTSPAPLGSPVQLWDAATLRNANALFATRSGIVWSVVNNGNDQPVKQVLHGVVQPVQGLEQSLTVAIPPDPVIPPDPILPPDPCFTVDIAAAQDGGGIVLHVDRLKSFGVDDGNGGSLQLCNARGVQVN
ncbi:MAG: hypothetical protein QM831_00715 [Kofleriaceae bacterium]